MQRVGVLGGTFDPIHYGHLAIAEECRWALDLARVYLVPAAKQPLKHNPHHATQQQRLEMVQLACADNPALQPSDIELNRPPPSFTVDTLLELRTMSGDTTTFWFILGTDAMKTLPQWHAAHRLLELAHVAVVSRPGITFEHDERAALEDALPGITARTQLVQGPLLDISSSNLRQRLATGQPVRYQIPDAVRAYIAQHGLYR